MIGHGFGAADRPRVIAITRRLVRFGLLAGVAIGVLTAALSPILGYVFTTEPAVAVALVPVTLITAIGVPLSGFVFVLDGVLIGAGDSRYLALTGILNVAVYLPLLWWAVQLGSLPALWTAFCLGYIGARAVTLGLRIRGERWLRLAQAR